MYENSLNYGGISSSSATFFFITSIIAFAGLWKMFEKAGKPGWAAIIPIYNIIIILEIIGKPMIWLLWLIIPCVNIVFFVWMFNLLVKSFGKSEGYTVGVLILPYVFYPIIGFGDSRYLGPSAKEARVFDPNRKFGDDNPFNQPPPSSQF